MRDLLLGKAVVAPRFCGLAPRSGHEHIMHDGQQPPPSVAAGAEGRLAFDCTDKRVLHHILGVITVAGERARIAPHRGDIVGESAGPAPSNLHGDAGKNRVSCAALSSDPGTMQGRMTPRQTVIDADHLPAQYPSDTGRRPRPP